MKRLLLSLMFSIISSITVLGYYDATSFFTALYYPQGAYFMTDKVGILVGTNSFRFMGTILSTYPFLKNYEIDANGSYSNQFTSAIPSAFVGFVYTNSDKWFGIGGGMN